MNATERKLHFHRVAQLPCMASGQYPVKLHHPMGGSMLERVGVRGTKKCSHWLVIPLAHSHHQGVEGIHTLGVETWEAKYGRQADMIDNLCRILRLDLWTLAANDKPEPRKYRRSSKLLAPREAL